MCENQQNLDLSWGMYMSWCMSCCHQILVLFYYDLCKLSWLLITWFLYIHILLYNVKCIDTCCHVMPYENWVNFLCCVHVIELGQSWFLYNHLILWSWEPWQTKMWNFLFIFSYLAMIAQYMNKSIMLWNVVKNVIMTSLPSRILKRKQSLSFNFKKHNWVRFKVLKEDELLVEISMKYFILKPTIQMTSY